MSTPHSQVTTPTDAYWALDPFAVVRPSDPWFVDLESLVPREHYGVTRRLQRDLGKSMRRPEFVHVGLMGHAGTGKTTLTRNAFATLSGDGITPCSSIRCRRSTRATSPSPTSSSCWPRP